MKGKFGWFAKHKVWTAVILLVLIISAASSSGGNKNTKNNQAPASNTSTTSQTTSSQQQQPKGEAKYSAQVVDYLAVNPADLKFWAQVDNTGTAAGTPECTVSAQDDSDTYHGFDIFDDNASLQPGKSWKWNGDLTITGQGASYVTQTKITCKNK